MNAKTVTTIIALGYTMVAGSSAFAQEQKVEFPQASPHSVVKQRVGLTDVEVDYSRPGVKGREVYGAMVPYGQVWRTGANQATKIVFSTPVKLNGKDVPAGTYALMTIPGKEEWTIIINKNADQWGAYKYDEKQDVVRFTAKPIAIDRSVETFSIDFGNVKDDSSEMKIVWDKTVVPVKVEVDVVDKVSAEIEKEMASSDAKKPYFQAAQFYYNHNKDLKQASKWVDQAIAERDAHYINYLKAEILAKLGDKTGAIAAAKHSSELAEKANEPGYVKLNNELIKSLQ